ncbi:hypothetical protein ACS0TY_024306 [Phlomoides rotata]
MLKDPLPATSLVLFANPTSIQSVSPLSILHLFSYVETPLYNPSAVISGVAKSSTKSGTSSGLYQFARALGLFSDLCTQVQFQTSSSSFFSIKMHVWLELAGNAARDNKKTRIVPRHIQLTGNVTIDNCGVMPNIHNLLLPKKAGSSKPAAGED